jgi:hypothetical protein
LDYGDDHFSFSLKLAARCSLLGAKKTLQTLSYFSTISSNNILLITIKVKKYKLFATGVLVVVFGGMFALFNKAYAADLLPKPIQDLFGLLGEEGAGTGEFVSSRLQMVLLLGLGAIVLVAVVFSALSAFKYISSQGDPGKIEEAGKAVQAIFLGIAVLFVAIVGIVLVFVFFGADIFTSAVYQTCISAANSQGCLACQADDGGLVDDWDSVKYTTSLPLDLREATDNQRTCTTCEWHYFKKSDDATHEIPDSCKE